MISLWRSIKFCFSCGCGRCRSNRRFMFANAVRSWLTGAEFGIPIPVAPPPILFRPLSRLWHDLVWAVRRRLRGRPAITWRYDSEAEIVDPTREILVKRATD